MNTTVIFREHDGEIIAFFPEIPGTGRYDCMSYLHFGQHGAASHEFYQQTSATMEYDDLLYELEAIGYVLAVRRRWTRAMDDKRGAWCDAWYVAGKGEGP